MWACRIIAALLICSSAQAATVCSGISRPNTGACNTSTESFTGAQAGNSGIGNYSWIAQNFVASSTYTACVCVARMALSTTNATARVTCAVYSDSSGAPGTRVGNFSYDVYQTTMGPSEQDVTFTGLYAPLTSGTTYWIVVFQSSYITGTEYFKWFFQSGPGGVVSLRSSSTDSWVANNVGFSQKFTLYK